MFFKVYSNYVGIVCYFDFLYYCFFLLVFIMDSNVLVFIYKGDVVYLLLVGYWSFFGVEKIGIVFGFLEIKIFIRL